MKRALWLFLLTLCFRADAQISMQALVPPAGVIQKSQLWNILLVSASETPVMVRISLRLLDAQTGEPVLTGVTKGFLLRKGAKQLQIDDVMPVQYEYLSTAIDRSVNGLIAPGSYIACYAVIDGDKATSDNREDCVPFTIEPVSPPLLNLPENAGIVETRLPQFSWLPPAPLNLFTDLNYDMLLTEVFAGQSAEESVQQNLPVFRATRLKDMYVNYPSSAPALDTAKQYAWQIIARNGSLFTAQTEIWTFRVKGLPKPVAESSVAYVKLKRELDGTVVNCRMVQAGYTNDAGDKTVKYEVLSLEESNRVVQSGELALGRGVNQLNVPLDRRKGYAVGKSYLFRLLNARNEYWQIKFIYTRD